MSDKKEKKKTEGQDAAEKDKPVINCEEEALRVQSEFCFSQDLRRLDFDIAGKPAAMFFLDGMSDKEILERNIIYPLKNAERLDKPFVNGLNRITFSSDPILVFEDFNEFVSIVSDGDIGLLLEGASEYYVFSARSYPTRGIMEPPVNTVLHGPREGFTEDLKTNLTMIRRRLRSPKLVTEMLKVGRYSETAVAVCHINGVTSPEVLEKIKKKIEKIDIDGIVDSSYIARFLEEKTHSIFKQVGINEKPDIVAAKMLEGRVAIVVDGSPIVLTLPFLVIENYQAAEDYYVKNLRGTVTRGIRIIAQIVAILLPGLYVSFQEFQYDVMPLKFMTVIMNNMFGLPFSPTLEMLLVLLFFEILNEASVKMPRHVSMALSIVGAIVLGEAAVNAGLISGPTVLVMAVSTLGIFCVPDAADAAGLLRLMFVLLAGVMGMFGVMLGVMAVIAYIVDINSQGTAMLAPLAPTLLNDLNDTIVKDDITDNDKRPESIPNVNRKRMKKDA